jgi:hypothetical protein
MPQFIREIGVKPHSVWDGQLSSEPAAACFMGIVSGTLVPLTDDEFRSIAGNVAPYLQGI